MSLLGLNGRGGSLLGAYGNRADELEREIENAALRLRSVGIDPTPPAPETGPLEKGLRVLNAPGSLVRSLLLEGVDDESGIDWGRAFSKERLWNNQVQGIQILDALGLAPEQTQDFSGANVGRFALGFGADMLTDPLSFLSGGITRGLKLGTPALPFLPSLERNLTQRGLFTPFAEGFGKGFRGGPAELVAETARQAIATPGPPPLPFGPPAPIHYQASQALQDLMTPKSLQEALGMGAGRLAKPLRGLFPNAATDADVLSLLRQRDSETMLEQGRAVNLIRDTARALPNAGDRQLVADLVENPAWFYGNYGVAMPLARGQKVADVLQQGGGQATLLQALETQRTGRLQAIHNQYGALADFNKLAFDKMLGGRFDEAHDIFRAINPEYHALTETLEQASALRGAFMPPEVEKAYKMSMAMTGLAANREVQRALLGSTLASYFPHVLRPGSAADLGLSGRGFSTRYGAQLQRQGPPTLELATQQGMPFVREFQYPLAKRMYDDIRAVNNWDVMNEILTQFGVKVDDVAQSMHMAAQNVHASALGPEFVKWSGTGKLAKLGEHFIPENAKYALDRLSKAYTTDDGIEAFKRLWDYGTNLWRPLVTTYSLPFHINNFLGNAWNMFLGGVDNPTRWADGINVFTGRQGVLQVGGHPPVDFVTLKELGLRTGALNAGFFRSEIGQDLMRLVNQGVRPNTGTWERIKVMGDYLKDKAHGLGEVVEGTSRATLFVDQMAKKIAGVGRNVQLTPDVLERFAREATDHVNSYLFDYRNGLSHFENEVARRLAPFWSWTRHNIPRQIAEIVEQPGKFLMFDKARDNIAMLKPPPTDTPPWLKEAIPTPFEGEGGNRIFFNPKLPLQDINRLMPGDNGRELLGMFNPLIKVPAQIATNQDFFTGKPLVRTPGETVTTPFPLRPFTAVAEQLGLKDRDLTPAAGDRMDPRYAKVYDELTGIAGRAGRAPDLFLREDIGDVDRLRAARMAFPGLYTYDAAKQKEQRLYNERARLQALLKKVKTETGQAAPPVKQLSPF